MALNKLSNFDALMAVTKDQSRTLSCKVIDNKASKGSTGLIDNRIFTGENELVARLDTNTMLWYLTYKMGSPPGVLKDQRWTSFSRLFKDVSKYFLDRNIEIKEVSATDSRSIDTK